MTTLHGTGKGTSSTQKRRLLGDMLVPKRVIQLPSSIRSFISGWIMIFQWHQPQPFSEIWLTIRQRFCLPRLIPPVIESILILRLKSGLDCGWMIIRNSPHYGKVSTTSSKQHAKGSYNPAPVDRCSHKGKTIKIQLFTVHFIHLRWCRIGIFHFRLVTLHVTVLLTL